MVFFWACEVSETKATAVEVPEGFVLNVCNATTGSFPSDGAVSLGVETLQMDKKPWKGVVAHLGKPVNAWQVKLDLVFSQKVKFYLAKGAGKVHVSGYFQPGPPSDMFEDDIPLIVGEPAAAEESIGKKSKKRAREESKAFVSWDQTPSSDSETEEATHKKEEKIAKAAPKDKAAAPAAAKKQEKKPPQQQTAPAANGNANPSQPGAGKKKRHKKHKKSNANASASQ